MAQRPKSKHNKKISDPPGIARYLCEPCLRGSGWARVYTHSPYLGFDNPTRICGNCDRPETVTRIRAGQKDAPKTEHRGPLYLDTVDASTIQNFAKEHGQAALLTELERELLH